MKTMYKYVVGITIVSLIITMFVLLGLFFAHNLYVKRTTVVAEGIVDSMYIDVSGNLFSTSTKYFIMIDMKAVEVSESAYNMIQVGDLVRVFADKHVVIL